MKNLIEERSHMVVKRNDLIQKSRHQMNLQEQKIVMYMISKIKPNDKAFREQIFSITEFCQICGLDGDSGGNYAYIKNTFKSISDKSIWVKLDNGSEMLLRWFNSVIINEKNGSVQLMFDEKMKPYLLELKDNYTKYELIYTLTMRSKYSIRLYELFKSYLYRGQVIFEIDLLKCLLFAEKYERNNNFKQKVLDIAVREINELTDIWIKYDFIKVGRKFSEVNFTISQKDIGERLTAGAKIEKVINKK